MCEGIKLGTIFGGVGVNISGRIASSELGVCCVLCTMWLPQYTNGRQAAIGLVVG